MCSMSRRSCELSAACAATTLSCSVMIAATILSCSKSLMIACSRAASADAAAISSAARTSALWAAGDRLIVGNSIGAACDGPDAGVSTAVGGP